MKPVLKDCTTPYKRNNENVLDLPDNKHKNWVICLKFDKNFSLIKEPHIPNPSKHCFFEEPGVTIYIILFSKRNKIKKLIFAINILLYIFRLLFIGYIHDISKNYNNKIEEKI
jgi:hypothetical protein